MQASNTRTIIEHEMSKLSIVCLSYSPFIIYVIIKVTKFLSITFHFNVRPIALVVMNGVVSEL